MKQFKRPPAIGFRIIKSAVAVALCFVVSFIRGNSGIVFYSQLAALWCIQMYVDNTWKNAKQRLIGTVIGAVYGLIFLLLTGNWRMEEAYKPYAEALVISLMIVVVLYTTVLIKKKQASYFSCVVFLSIVVNHIGDANPYLFVWNRFLDTVIGIVIGIMVNTFQFPREKQQDILFISGLDDTLLSKNNCLSDYSRVELNRMIDEGANFTISTMRTPASLMEPMRDIHIKLPVIAMDGAVLFDIYEKQYLKVYVMSQSTSRELLGIIHDAGLHCFSNVIIDDLLVIYHDDTKDEVHEKLVKEMRRSPYRNYVQRELPQTEAVVYFMLLYPKEIIEAFYRKLEHMQITKELKVLMYDSEDYPGYAYIKIYNRNATKENMIGQLKEITGLEKTVTFGTIPERYDVLVEEGDINCVVHTLKKLYEPFRWFSHVR